MSMHPELEHAINNTGVPILEVINIFTKHHSAPIEEHINRHSASLGYTKDSGDSSFWDTWQPLFHRLHYPGGSLGVSADDIFLNIHKGLTKEVISWLCDSQRKSNVYLLAEPPTPKLSSLEEDYRKGNDCAWANSRASVFATICSKAHRFGDEQASHRDTISKIAAGLAAYYPPFRRILTKKLIDNPGILDLPARTRFKKLIHEPWKSLRESHPHYIATPPVVVLAWNFEEIQELFHEVDSSPRSSPLLWIISIDADYVLPQPLDSLDPFLQLQYTRLPVRYNDGASDTALILHHRFDTLRQRYKGMWDRDEMWPTQKQMLHLITLFSGVFESIDAVINFVDCMEGGGPRVHLQTFLAYMDDSPAPSDDRPYCALDHFYIKAYSHIPPHLLSIAQDILSIMDFAYYWPITPLQLACLLSIEEATVLSVFTYLSRWAVFRTGDHYEIIELFKRFCEDPTRSGHFHTSDILALQVFQHFLSYSSNLSVILNPSIQVNAKAYTEFEMVRCWASHFFYPQSIHSNRQDYEYFSTRLFDFRCLAYTCDQIYPTGFCGFLKKLYAWDKINSPSIIRVDAASPLDKQLIDSCEGLADPLDLDDREWPSSPKYALLGIDSKTVLVLLYNSEEFGTDRFPKVNIYTSAMLDFV